MNVDVTAINFNVIHTPLSKGIGIGLQMAQDARIPATGEVTVILVDAKLEPQAVDLRRRERNAGQHVSISWLTYVVSQGRNARWKSNRIGLKLAILIPHPVHPAVVNDDVFIAHIKEAFQHHFLCHLLEQVFTADIPIHRPDDRLCVDALCSPDTIQWISLTVSVATESFPRHPTHWRRSGQAIVQAIDVLESEDQQDGSYKYNLLHGAFSSQVSDSQCLCQRKTKKIMTGVKKLVVDEQQQHQTRCQERPWQVSCYHHSNCDPTTRIKWTDNKCVAMQRRNCKLI